MPRKKEYEIDVVLNKAMHTFWANGYENTSVRMLEQEMGINQFSIYAGFGNKHDLFIEVLKRYKVEVKTRFLKDLLNSDGSLEDIRKFLFGFGRSICSGENPNGCLMVSTGMEIGNDDVEISKQLYQYFDFIKTTFFDHFQKAKLIGELPESFDSEQKAEFLLASLQGLTLYAKFRDEYKIQNYVDSVMKIIV